MEHKKPEEDMLRGGCCNNKSFFSSNIAHQVCYFTICTKSFPRDVFKEAAQETDSCLLLFDNINQMMLNIYITINFSGQMHKTKYISIIVKCLQP